MRVTGHKAPDKSGIERRELQPIAAPPPWHLHLFPGSAEALVVSFASIGHDNSQVPSPEFLGSATAGGRPALFLADESRSWANAPGFIPLLEAAIARVRQSQTISRILLIGQSMGGFAALIAAAQIKVDAVIAISPQFSVDQEVIKDDRWASWTDRIPQHHHRHAPLAADCRITLMHGLRDDQAQALAFPEAANVDHILFPELGHSDLAPHLKTRGCLPGLIEAALAQDRRRLLRIASSAGGRLRAKLKDQLPR